MNLATKSYVHHVTITVAVSSGRWSFTYRRHINVASELIVYAWNFELPSCRVLW